MSGIISFFPLTYLLSICGFGDQPVPLLLDGLPHLLHQLFSCFCFFLRIRLICYSEQGDWLSCLDRETGLSLGTPDSGGTVGRKLFFS